MRRDRASSIILVVLLFSSLAFPLVSANQLVISEDITWSGEITLDKDVVISPGTTLQIEPGTTIDATNGHKIEVLGSMIAEGAQFFSTAIPTAQSSHGQGLWQGIIVNPGGIASLTDVLIENANVGVKSYGELSATNLTVKNAYFGIKNYATATIHDFRTEAIDYDAIMNSGSFTLTTANISNASTGIQTDGVFAASSINLNHVGTGVSAVSGTVNLDQIYLQNISVGFTSSYGISFRASNVTGEHVNLLANVANSDDFLLSDATLLGHSLMKSMSTSSSNLRDVYFTVSESGHGPVVDQNCIGKCSLHNITITNAEHGLTLSGTGQHQLVNSTFEATDYAIRSSGYGTLLVNNSDIIAGKSGIIIRNSDSIFTGQNKISISEQDATGLDILGGNHVVNDLIVAKHYDSTDSSSIGIQAWYTSIEAGDLTTENFSTGITMRSTDLTAGTVSNFGGNLVGTEIIDSSASILSITTKYQNNGLILSENSQLTSYQASAQYHDNPLQIDVDSIAHVLDFVTINTNPSYSDASGQGSLYYGYNPSLDISTTVSDYFVSTKVKFTDMSNNAIQAVIKVNTFQFITDENGEVILPLLSTGSITAASVEGVGVQRLLIGGITGQEVKIPVIPNGDWIISGSEIITLQSLDISQPLSGDLMLQDNAILQIIDMTLTMGANMAIVVEDNAQILGLNSSITADRIYVNDTSSISSVDSESTLTIDSIVEWNCQGETVVENLFFIQHLKLGSGCQLINNNGGAPEQLVVPVDSSFKVTSSLEISVVDRGLPISNAIIQFDGAEYYTDSSGKVTIDSIARLVDSQRDIIGVNENVILRFGDFNELITWNTSYAKSHQFVVSSLHVSEIDNDDVTLESIWSPYYLQNDLTIPLGRTLTLIEGVALRISDGIQISVMGTLDAQNATFSSTGFGDRWSGLVMESQYSTVQLQGSTILEASPAITFEGGNLDADQVSISRSSSSRALIEINEQNGGSFSLTNSILSDASGACIDVVETTIQLKLRDIELHRCNGPAIRAENAHFDVINLAIGEGSSDGLTLSNVDGRIHGLAATEFNGDGHIIKLDYINNDLIISDIDGKVGGSAGIGGANNRALNLESIRLTGAPAIDFDRSAGRLANVSLSGQGFGTGLISHHGRYSSSLEISNLTVDDYTIGVDLHADGADTTAPLRVDNANISASTAFSVDNYPIVVDNATIVGEVDVAGSIIVELIDVPLSQEVAIYDGAIVEFFQTINMHSNHLEMVKPTNYALESTYSNGVQINNNVEGQYVKSVVKLQTRSGLSADDVTISELKITANSTGHPTETQLLSFLDIINLQSPVVFNLAENQMPEIESVTPNSATSIMQTIPFESTIIAIDDYDQPDELTYEWTIFADDGSEIYKHISMNSSTELTISLPGSYLLQIKVVDSNLAYQVEVIPFEVKLLDSDGDYTDTCDAATWFDLSSSRACGPDVYDSDDDNDGIIDTRDEWPLDSCAWQDTDGDGQPDELNCPDGFVSELFEDQDDDGDGIPDSLEGSFDQDGGQFDSVTLILLVICAAAVILFIMRSRKGLQK